MENSCTHSTALQYRVYQGNMVEASDSFLLCHNDPTAFFGALRNGVTKKHFLMPGFESGEGARSLEITLRDVAVNILEKLGECIGITLGVAGRVLRVATSGRRHLRRIFGDFFVRFTPLADP